MRLPYPLLEFKANLVYNLTRGKRSCPVRTGQGIDAFL